MKISLISTSHRKQSQSQRICKIFKKIIEEINNEIQCYHLDMHESEIPLWTSERKENKT